MVTLQALFGQFQTPERRLSADQCREIIGDYARLLEDDAPLPGCVADIDKLPHGKDRIKLALLTCMVADGGDPETLLHLRHGYLMLAAFQPGVGEQNVGVRYAKLDLEEDPALIAARLDWQERRLSRWRPMIIAEQGQLEQELRAAGVDYLH